MHTRRAMFSAVLMLPAAAVVSREAVASGELEGEMVRRRRAAQELSCALAQLREEVDALRTLKGGHFLTEDEFSASMRVVSSPTSLHTCSEQCLHRMF